LLNVYLE